MFADGGLTGEELLGGLGEAPVPVNRGEYFQVSSFYLSYPVLKLFQNAFKSGT